MTGEQVDGDRSVRATRSPEITVVTRFFELMTRAAETRSREALAEQAELVAPDIVYRNIPLRTVRGTQEMAEFRRAFAGAEFMRIELCHVGQDGHRILMERDEQWRLNDITVGDTIMGIMTVEAGRIVTWTDYQANYPSWRASGQMPESFWKRWGTPQIL